MKPLANYLKNNEFTCYHLSNVVHSPLIAGKYSSRAGKDPATSPSSLWLGSQTRGQVIQRRIMRQNGAPTVRDSCSLKYGEKNCCARGDSALRRSSPSFYQEIQSASRSPSSRGLLDRQKRNDPETRKREDSSNRRPRLFLGRSDRSRKRASIFSIAESDDGAGEATL